MEFSATQQDRILTNVSGIFIEFDMLSRILNTDNEGLKIYTCSCSITLFMLMQLGTYIGIKIFLMMCAPSPSILSFYPFMLEYFIVYYNI